uniref:Uncharacterized protein n=1 Tax=Salix viminalis TaxID=40686 RepID=A0A6N2KFV9_SALVM
MDTTAEIPPRDEQYALNISLGHRFLHGKQLRHTLRFHSQQWRTWAACSIQAAWRRYSKKKLSGKRKIDCKMH